MHYFKNKRGRETAQAGFLLKPLRLTVKNSSPDSEEFTYVGVQ